MAKTGKSKKAVARKPVTIETGSGDVFVDLGFADAGERKLRVQLAMQLNDLIAARRVTQAKAAALLGIPQPDYIKMDVDGIEHLILKGAGSVLADAKGVLVEINDQFAEQENDARTYLLAAGFVLKEKRHADYFDVYSNAAKYTFNQIWIKG